MLAAAYPAGTRNSGLASEAGRLHSRGVSGSDLTGELLTLNAWKCVPPLPEKEVRGVARSIDRYPVRPGSGIRADYEPLEAPLSRWKPWNPSMVLERVLRDEKSARYWHGDWSGVSGATELDRVSRTAYLLCNRVAFEAMRIGMEPTAKDVASLVLQSAVNVSYAIVERTATDALAWLHTVGYREERLTRWSLIETDEHYAEVLAKAVARFDEPPTWYRTLKANKQSYPTKARRENIEAIATANGTLVAGSFWKQSGRKQKRLLADFHLAKIAGSPVLVELDRTAPLVASPILETLIYIGFSATINTVLAETLPPESTNPALWRVARAVIFAGESGLTRTDLQRKVGHYRMSASRLDSLLAQLSESGLFQSVKIAQPGRGRPAIRFSLTAEARSMAERQALMSQESTSLQGAKPDPFAVSMERWKAESEAEELAWRTVPQVTVTIKTDEDRKRVESVMGPYWKCGTGTHLVRFIDGEDCREAVVFDWLAKQIDRIFGPKPGPSDKPVTPSRFALKPASETGPQFTSVKPETNLPAHGKTEPQAVQSETVSRIEPSFILVTSDTQEGAKFHGAISPFRYYPGRSILVRLTVAGETSEHLTTAEGLKRLVRFFGDSVPAASDSKPVRMMRLESEADRRERLAKLRSTYNAEAESQAA